MPSSNTSVIPLNKLLIEVAKNIDAFGEEQTYQLLYKQRTKNLFYSNHMNFIIRMVCDVLSISPEQVLNDKSKHSFKRVLTMKFIAYYGYECFKDHGVSFEDVALKLKRRPSTIHKHYIEMSEKRKDKTKENEFILNHFRTFDLKTKKYFNNTQKAKK